MFGVPVDVIRAEVNKRNLTTKSPKLHRIENHEIEDAVNSVLCGMSLKDACNKYSISKTQLREALQNEVDLEPKEETNGDDADASYYEENAANSSATLDETHDTDYSGRAVSIIKAKDTIGLQSVFETQATEAMRRRVAQALKAKAKVLQIRKEVPDVREENQTRRIKNIINEKGTLVDEIEVICGDCIGVLHRNKFLCPGLHRHCILTSGQWVTPKQFSIMGGKASLKNWKNAIRVLNVNINLRTFMEAGTLDFFNHDNNCSGKCSHNTSFGGGQGKYQTRINTLEQKQLGSLCNKGKYQTRIDTLEQKQLGTIKRFNQAIGDSPNTGFSTPNTSVMSDSVDDLPTPPIGSIIQNIKNSTAYRLMRRAQSDEQDTDQPVFPMPEIKCEKLDDYEDFNNGTPQQHSDLLLTPSSGPKVTSTPIINTLGPPRNKYKPHYPASMGSMSSTSTPTMFHGSGATPVLASSQIGAHQPGSLPVIAGPQVRFNATDGMPMVPGSQIGYMNPLPFATLSQGKAVPTISYLVQNGHIQGEVKQVGQHFVLQKAMTSPLPDVLSVASAFPDIDSIMKDSPTFWKGIVEIGIMEEVFSDIKAKLKCLKHEMLNFVLSEENTKQLSSVINTLGLQTKLKYKLANHKVNSDKQNNELQRKIEELQREVEENQRRQAELKRKSDCLDQLITTSNKKTCQESIIDELSLQITQPISIKPEEEDEDPIPVKVVGDQAQEWDDEDDDDETEIDDDGLDHDLDHDGDLDDPDHGDSDHGNLDHGDPDHGEPDHADPDHGSLDNGDLDDHDDTDQEANNKADNKPEANHVDNNKASSHNNEGDPDNNTDPPEDVNANLTPADGDNSSTDQSRNDTTLSQHGSGGNKKNKSLSPNNIMSSRTRSSSRNKDDATKLNIVF